MSPLIRPGKHFLNYKSVLFLSIFAISIIDIPAASAHKVQVTTDVGATLHLEPNDNPSAGEPSLAWFALTRKGGKVIPLKECNCKLAVYAQPHSAKEPALIEPALKPVTAERYQGIPGATITFPKPGAYQLQLTGKPASGATFSPFKLNFEVTVASGSATTQPNTQKIENVNSGVRKTDSNQLPLWAIAIPILGVAGIFMVLLQRRKRE